MIPVEANTEQFIKELRAAYHKAIAEGIRANAIVINKNMVKVPKTPIALDDCRGLRIMPEMICGLNIIWTMDELPDNYTFAMVAGHDDSARLAKFEAIGMEPEELRKAAEIYRKIKEVEE